MNPQAFSYTLMKLFAFRDRKDDAESEFARHHAFDFYRIIAMLTVAEYTVAKRLACSPAQDQHQWSATRIPFGH